MVRSTPWRGMGQWRSTSTHCRPGPWIEGCDQLHALAALPTLPIEWGAGISTGWTVRVSNPGRGKIFFSHTRPDRLWGSPSLVFSGYRRSFAGIKRPGRYDLSPLAPKLWMSGVMLPLCAIVVWPDTANLFYPLNGNLNEIHVVQMRIILALVESRNSDLSCVQPVTLSL